MEPAWTTDKFPKKSQTAPAVAGEQPGIFYGGTRSHLCLGEKMVAKGHTGNTGASTLPAGTERHLGTGKMAGAGGRESVPRAQSSMCVDKHNA